MKSLVWNTFSWWACFYP